MMVELSARVALDRIRGEPALAAVLPESTDEERASLVRALEQLREVVFKE